MPMLLQHSYAPLPIAPVAFLIPNFFHAPHGHANGRNQDYCRQMRRWL